MMRTSDRPVPIAGLQELVHRAWMDLTQARQDGNFDQIRLAERRMNALLDRLSASTLIAG